MSQPIFMPRPIFTGKLYASADDMLEKNTMSVHIALQAIKSLSW